jgi:hypothetical protein
LNDANEPSAVLGAAVDDTAANPGGKMIGNPIEPAVFRSPSAESSNATMYLQTSMLQ